MWGVSVRSARCGSHGGGGQHGAEATERRPRGGGPRGPCDCRALGARTVPSGRCRETACSGTFPSWSGSWCLRLLAQLCLSWGAVWRWARPEPVLGSSPSDPAGSPRDPASDTQARLPKGGRPSCSLMRVLHRQVLSARTPPSAEFRRPSISGRATTKKAESSQAIGVRLRTCPSSAGPGSTAGSSPTGPGALRGPFRPRDPGTRPHAREAPAASCPSARACPGGDTRYRAGRTPRFLARTFRGEKPLSF